VPVRGMRLTVLRAWTKTRSGRLGRQINESAATTYPQSPTWRDQKKPRVARASSEDGTLIDVSLSTGRSDAEI
jgi:hypothetical protein